MEPLSSTKIFGISFMLTIILLISVPILFYAGAFGQEDNFNKKYDIVLLSQMYNSEGLFSDEITGDILNNGTATIKAVEITAIFYDDQDDIIGKERSGTSPYSISPGDTATFNIELFDEPIQINASSYDFTAKWKDEYLFSSYFTRLTGGEIDADSSSEDDGEDVDNN